MRFITRRGLGLTLAAVGLFVIGDVTRTGWVQIADALFWGALVVSAIVTPFSSGGVSASPRLDWQRSSTTGASTGPAQGDTAEVVVEVRNRRLWPRFGLTLGYDLRINGAPATPRADERVSLYLPFLAPGASVTVRGVLPLKRRGLHVLSEGRATSEAPFGLFRRRQHLDGESSLLVHPAPVEVAAEQTRHALGGGTPRPVTARMGEEVSGSRSFAAGDPLRSVHWRNSARMGRLMAKSYTANDTDASVLLLAVEQAGGAERGEVLDDLCRVAAGVAHVWGVRGTPLALLAGRDPRAAGWGEVLTYLARLTPEAMDPLGEQLERLGPGSTVAAVVDASDEESLEALARGASRVGGVDVWLVSDVNPEKEWQLKRAVSLLQTAGVAVTTVARPLPEPGSAA